MNQPLPIAAVKASVRGTLLEAGGKLTALKERLLLQGNREATQDAIEYIGYALTALADVDDEGAESRVN